MKAEEQGWSEAASPNVTHSGEKTGNVTWSIFPGADETQTTMGFKDW